MLDRITPERWRKLEPLLDSALELEAEYRASYLETACGGESDLRADLERLLGCCERAEVFLARPGSEAFAALLADVRDAAPLGAVCVGPYRILRELGHGGMGAVYLAERADGQFEQRVALKVVRGALSADDHLVRRFLEERQILASLQHPDIARLLDGGVTADGLPWFAMEYVEGTAIDRYCDARRLPIDARLDVFLAVCDAVQFAHRNLVIHRDLKPSNILVTQAGEVRLLDFGIAKLVTGGESGVPATLTGLHALTPEYASPEQIRGEPATTASDVYSLGVVLCELLTGQRPYRLATRARQEVERAVLEGTIARPSSLIGASAAVGANRGTTADRLRRRLRGDLDTIVLTALQKEPERRYGTVDRLAADIRRLLADRPVSARPDTWMYRARKFGRRHPLGLASSAMILLLLVGFSVLTAMQSARTARERDRAERVSSFLIELLSAPDPWNRPGRTVTVRDVLDSAAARVDRELADRPDLRAELLSVVGRSYAGLRLLDDSRRHLDSALALWHRLGGEAPSLARDQLALSQVAMLRGDLAAAESLGRASLATAEQLYGQGHPALTPHLRFMGSLLSVAGHWADAEQFLRAVVRLRREQASDSAHTLADALNPLAHLLWLRGERSEAESLYREALALYRDSLHENHPAAAHTYLGLARLLHDRGDSAAEAVSRRGLELARRVTGEEHPATVDLMTLLAEILADRGELAPAESLYRASLAILRRTEPSGGQFTGLALAGLGRVVLDRGDAVGAEPRLREALGFYQARGMPPWQFGHVLEDLGRSLTRQRRYEEAEPLLVRSLEARSAAWGQEHARTLRSIRALAALYDAWGKPEQAREYRQRLEQARAER